MATYTQEQKIRIFEHDLRQNLRQIGVLRGEIHTHFDHATLSTWVQLRTPERTVRVCVTDEILECHSSEFVLRNTMDGLIEELCVDDGALRFASRTYRFRLQPKKRVRLPPNEQGICWYY